MDLEFLYTKHNLLWLVWIIVITVIGFLGTWHYLKPHTMSEFIAGAFLYGRIVPNVQYKILKYIELPKSWFTHFYAYATVIHLINLTIAFRLYFYNIPVPDLAKAMLNFLLPFRNVSTDSLAAIIVLILMAFHTARRFYECIFISVYSKAHMNIIHYSLGLLFYYSVAVLLISECPGYSTLDFKAKNFAVPPLELKWYHVTGTILYILATVIHHGTHISLANLRKNPAGKVVTLQHKIPRGIWFRFISCPHYFAEILIYISVEMILGFQHTGLWIVNIWVIVCQIVAGLHVHGWYLEKHGDAYPKNRKAIIPFVL